MIQKVTDRADLVAGRLDISCLDFPVTWAGRGRHDDEFCFGSEDGRVRFTTVDGKPIAETSADEKYSEAVNGVAFSGNLMAVSSRSEVVFWEMPKSGETQGRPACVPYGSHGVIASAAGGFIAPLGPGGLMHARMSDDGTSVSIERVRPFDEVLDFYRVVGFASKESELPVCAVRRNGIATIDSSGDPKSPTLNFTIHGELDVIDVCSLATSAAPRAAAGLCRDGTVLLFHDVLDQAGRIAVRLNEIQGTAYRVFCAPEIIVILTSHGLYFFPGMAEHVLHRKRAPAPPIHGVVEHIEAIDANLVGERWLLVVTTDAVRRYDVSRFGRKLHDKPVHELQTFHPIASAPFVTRRSGTAELVACSLTGANGD